MPSYSSLLLVMAIAMSVLVVIYLLRRRWWSHPEGLQSLLKRHPAAADPSHHQLVVPLLLYEDQFPAFGKILRLVLSRFSLRDFLQDQEFRKAIQFLSDSISQPPNPERLAGAICVVVRAFVSNPEVEYHCRPDLKQHLEQLLAELEQQ